MIIISDLHLKYQKEPYSKSQREFLQWLEDSYSNEQIIFLGDVFDTRPHWTVFKMFKDFLERRGNKTYILNGNHDLSKAKGSSVLSLQTSFLDVEERIIEGYNCLMLPYKYDYREYENLEGEYNFIFTHITPVQAQFANEGIAFPKLKGTFIHGHTHTKLDFIDDYGNQHYIVGVPLPTRHLEDFEHRIIKIKDGKINFIQPPFYFNYETIKYGEEPKDKNNILNIVDAPSRKVALEKYKEYYIRKAGIQVLRTDNTIETFKQEFESGNILDKFKIFSIENKISKEVAECCSERLSTII